ncbi:hypothetical protein A2680_00050 [Candidatus Kaiserbacteria bacterium RIFCSPHIGHO2_01_FULL_55_37]|nr:MAG: hypothetical protein A2680_00050 [Candidatus Kaiserbacteria bacterium RIFCSPHIGHO2_01_FULL_55_37]
MLENEDDGAKPGITAKIVETSERLLDSNETANVLIIVLVVLAILPILGIGVILTSVTAPTYPTELSN